MHGFAARSLTHGGRVGIINFEADGTPAPPSRSPASGQKRRSCPHARSWDHSHGERAPPDRPPTRCGRPVRVSVDGARAGGHSDHHPNTPASRPGGTTRRSVRHPSRPAPNTTTVPRPRARRPAQPARAHRPPVPPDVAADLARRPRAGAAAGRRRPVGRDRDAVGDRRGHRGDRPAAGDLHRRRACTPASSNRFASREGARRKGQPLARSAAERQSVRRSSPMRAG